MATLGGCADLGFEDCGAAPWGDRSWPTDALYVDASADPEVADGSRQRPFGTIRAALSAPERSGPVVLASGVYESPGILTDGAHIAGRCASGVVLEGALTAPFDGARVRLESLTVVSESDEGPALDLGGGTMVLDGVRVRGGSEAAIKVDGGALDAHGIEVGPSGSVGLLTVGGAARCRGCLVREVSGAGVLVRGSGAQLEWLGGAIVDVGHDAQGGFGQGVRIESGDAVVEDVVLSDNLGAGLAVVGGELRGARLAVVVSPGSVASGAVGIGIQAGGVLRLEDAALINLGAGLVVGGGSASVERLLVRGHSLGDGPSSGVAVLAGGSLDLLWADVDDVAGRGIVVDGAEASVARLRVAGVVQKPGGSIPHGLSVVSGSTVSVRETVLSDCQAIAVRIDNSALVADSVVVRDTQPLAQGFLGLGMHARASSRVTMRDALLTGNRGAGVVVGNESVIPRLPVLVELARIQISDTLPELSNGRFGAGLEVFGGSAVSLSDVVLDSNSSHGLLARGVGTRIEAQRLLARGDRSSFGLEISGGAALALTDAQITGSEGAGVRVIGGTIEDARRWWIAGTAPRRSDGLSGHGLAADAGSAVSIEDVRIEDNARFGALISQSVLHLARGVITGHEVGVAQQLTATVTLEEVWVEGNAENEVLCLSVCTNGGQEPEDVDFVP